MYNTLVVRQYLILGANHEIWQNSFYHLVNLHIHKGNFHFRSISTVSVVYAIVHSVLRYQSTY